jgi:hypothetical protein
LPVTVAPGDALLAPAITRRVIEDYAYESGLVEPGGG